MLSIPHGLAIFSPPFPYGPWAGGEEIDRDIPFRMDYSKISYSLHFIQLLVSVFIPIYCKRKLLWSWLSMTWISESSEFFYEPFCCYIPLVEHVFFPPLGSCLYSVRFLNIQTMFRDGFHLTEWALNSTSKYICTLTMFVPLRYYILHEATVEDQRFCSWVCGYYSPLTACRVPSSILYTSQEGWRFLDGANSHSRFSMCKCYLRA